MSAGKEMQTVHPREPSEIPGGARGKEPICQCRRHKKHGFDPWVRKISWNRKRQPTPVFLSGESQRERRLAGYCPWGHKESDTTEVTWHNTAHTGSWYSKRNYLLFKTSSGPAIVLENQNPYFKKMPTDS